ncbi:hypothetical protein QTG54_001513 [Skeletonema marinoi]|uniref:Uncharacterized protein n=1 Tax=Skeletonema marinoi TaxID=267567 RepID=A0AAD8YLI6_9STRA|nr:hypothetical protein QTG54_001513 [Skeletonema marinoi]
MAALRLRRYHLKSENNHTMKRPNNNKIIQLSICCAAVAVASTSYDVHRPCFVSSPLLRINSGRYDGSKRSSVASTPTNNLFRPSFGHKRHRSSLIRHMGQNDNQEGYDDGDYDEDEEDYDDMEANLNKISWLPSVKLGKQPFKPPYTKSSESRRESANQDRYETISPSSSAPPGFDNIDVLPVLPMKMVHGLDGLLTNNDDDHDDHTLDAISAEDIIGMSYTGGVWDEEGLSGVGLSSMTSSFGPLFSGTSAFLPHTKGHVFTIAEPRYKKLYDDLLRMGSYYGKKRESAIRRAKETGDTNLSLPPDPDEKRRFIVTAASPQEEGVFAEYGLLFQLRDLDEVAAVASYDVSGGDGSISLEDLQELVEAGDDQEIYGEVEDGEDIMDILLQTHYEATHDCIGRVKIHRFVNPECWEDGPDGDEYLMAEASIVDLVGTEELSKERNMASVEKASTELQAGMDDQQQQQQTSSSSLSSTAMKMQEQMKRQASKDISSAVARIKDELRSAVGDSFKKQQNLDADKIKDDLMAALGSNLSGSDNNRNSKSNRSSIPLAPKIVVDRRSDDSLTKEERGLRESFAKLVALQHELKEECRFTRVSVQTFGIGSVAMWLSAAAWSQFVEKRLEATQNDMHKDLQAKLAEFMSSGGGDLSEKFNAYDDDDSGALTIDFEELSPDLQKELQLVQARATEELGPLALERAIHMQRIVQARTYDERLIILRECVDSERQRLEAKKMLQSAFDGDFAEDGGEDTSSTLFSREEARNVFERLMFSTSEEDKGMTFENFDDAAFQ